MKVCWFFVLSEGGNVWVVYIGEGKVRGRGVNAHLVSELEEGGH